LFFLLLYSPLGGFGENPLVGLTELAVVASCSVLNLAWNRWSLGGAAVVDLATTLLFLVGLVAVLWEKRRLVGLADFGSSSFSESSSWRLASEVVA
jgi:hypothetical protein